MRVENDSDPKGVGEDVSRSREDADLSSSKKRILPRLIPTAAAEGNAQAHSSQSIGRWVSFGIVAATAVVGLIVLRKTTHHPRTDDAAVLANYIGIAPQVEGAYHLSHEQYAFVSTMAFFGFAASILVASPMLDALGMRNLLYLALILHIGGILRDHRQTRVALTRGLGHLEHPRRGGTVAQHHPRLIHHHQPPHLR